MISENLKDVHNRIDAAELRANRNAGSAKLIAVTKTKPVSDLMEAYQAGERDFGENKVQEMLEKQEQLPKDIRWHLIGHLQTNKVKYVVGNVFLIHSVDSLRLAEEISKVAVKKNVTADILIEVNAANEESKFGTALEETLSLVENIAKLPNISIKGLMTIAPFTEDAESNRKYFRALKELSVDITRKNVDNVSMDILSMGMTGDYEVAVEEGASYVRVGTGIFGMRRLSISE
ncbi:MAG: YggS family pyridoxal phosphate-dependent enzyme [Lachnospiraceae bacterium]|nr:YggS family pyridoxal phosphate-dependent enzyme [Lachnospiraceae bacterium]